MRNIFPLKNDIHFLLKYALNMKNWYVLLAQVQQGCISKLIFLFYFKRYIKLHSLNGKSAFRQMKNTLLYVIEGREHDIINVDQHESFECFAILKSDSKWFNTSVFRGKHKLQIIWQMTWLHSQHHTATLYLCHLIQLILWSGEISFSF